MLILDMMWIIFWKLLSSLLRNSSEVQSLTRATIRVCRLRRMKKTIRVILAVSPVYRK